LIKADYEYDPPVCTECSDCVTCTSTTQISSSTQRITLSTADCSYDPVNWLCCLSSSDQLGDYAEITSCVLTSCNSAFEDDKIWDSNMCQDVSFLEYEVPTSANYITIQVHNNDFNGNKNCGNGDIDCCCNSWSSCYTAESGVCEVVVDLSTCPSTDYPAPECETDYDCAHLDQECAVGYCSYGTCVPVYSGSHFMCRPSVGDCDAPEYCNGYDGFCPEDVKYSYDTECRPKVSECDHAEACDGYSNECPTDVWEGEGVECREATSICDVPEYCTGYSGECPEDVRHDHGYTFKCSTTQFLCGIKREELSTNSGGSYFIGNCGIGTALEFVDLSYPDCLNECLNEKCPNKRGLSNWSEAHCDSYSGNWVCDNKYEMGQADVPYCFPWNRN